jgi:glycosyltransferase involved in cell wall biosynthesis/peptidoglycan/xylan/chitin deacetylase (PgdA/CDA1 family)
VYAERAFAVFVGRLGERVDRLVLLGREDPKPGRSHYRLPDRTEFVALPYYPSLAKPISGAPAMARSLGTFWRVLDDVDAVWLLGPSPLTMAFALLARVRGRAVVLGVRQDLPRYARSRHPGRPAMLAAAAVLEGLHRLMARGASAIVVGPDLARHYRRSRRLLTLSVSLVRTEDIVSEAQALARAYDGELRVLSVGRLEAEKNPLLLAEVLRRLNAEHPRWRLVVCGEGPMEGELREALRAAGVEDRAELRGYVPIEGGLLELYRESHAFLHVSWTEGLPQVLFEAFAAGLPTVATAVGSVSEAAGDSALLVPPGDPGAAASELERVARDEPLRRRLVSSGLERARRHTIDAECDRVRDFIAGAVRAEPAPARGGRTHALMYHDVVPVDEPNRAGFAGSVASPYKLDLELFVRHLDAIGAGGVPVSLFTAEAHGPQAVLTFDDGGSSALIAAEQLERRGWRGHFFVTTGCIGSEGFLDPDSIVELARRGHDVGSHSDTHPTYFGGLPRDRILSEWRTSREKLGELLGRAPVSASVPGGFLSKEVIECAEEVGYGVLMTSEPTSRVVTHGGVRVVGRYAVRSTTSAERAAALARGDRSATARQAVEWTIKQRAKRLSPAAFELARRLRPRDLTVR